MLTGKLVYLRLMEEKDVAYKVKWVNDPEIRATLNFDFPISEIATKQWLYKNAINETRRDFIICTLEYDRPIGFCGFLNIDRKNSKAESYMTIGEKDYWGKGYAKEVRNLLLEYAFMELNLNKVYSYVWTNNEKMIKLNENAGFIKEGILVQDIFSHGEFRDRVIMGLLREDYLKKYQLKQE
jgi:RimJ/RimL family protein N-acetyltransferase